jgi:hypothetical protein
MTPEAEKFMLQLAEAFKAKGITNRQVQSFKRKRGGVYDELLKLGYVELRGTDSLILSPSGWAWVTTRQAS